MPHQRQELDRGEHDPKGSRHRTACRGDAGDRDQRGGRREERPRARRRPSKGGAEYFQPADVVLLAGYTYENVRMLLLSKSKPFPNGLANNGGQVGRHYMTHHTAATLTALFPFDLNNWYGLPAQGVAVDNWADDNFDHAGLDFIGGGNLWVYSDRRPISAAIMSTFGQAPTWGASWKAFIKETRYAAPWRQSAVVAENEENQRLDAPAIIAPLRRPAGLARGQRKLDSWDRGERLSNAAGSSFISRR